MSYADYPAETDAEKILHGLDDLSKRLDEIVTRLDMQRDGINQCGENVAWLVQNVQGIFAMVNSPTFMSQMMGAVTGGFNGGSAESGTTGEDTGADRDGILGQA